MCTDRCNAQKKSEDAARLREEKQIKAAEAAERQKVERERTEHRKKWGFWGKWCNYCRSEAAEDLERCAKCNAPLQTAEERKENLMAKVQQYQQERANRAAGRERWKLWQETRSFKRAGAAEWQENYQRWDVFENSSDEEDQLPDAPPPDTPEFRAMEKDMDERAARKAEKRRIAEQLKEKGNAALARGDIREAIKFYTEGLENSKDYKPLYTNRALAYMKKEQVRTLSGWLVFVGTCVSFDVIGNVACTLLSL